MNEEVQYNMYLEKALSDYKNIKDFKENIGKNLFFAEAPEKTEFNLVITIGGDGTILWAHKLLQNERLPPFLCFDGGSLCFLSNFSIRKLDQVLEYVHQKAKEDEPFDIFPLPRIKSYVKKIEKK